MYYSRNVQDSSLIADIQKAINGEYSAINCYAQLAEQAINGDEKQKIVEIRNDEIKHYNAFQGIYMSLTGSQATPQLTEACANTYKKGIEAAFIDEQETVDFYLDIADKAQNTYIKDTFKRAAADEQNHAVWFSFFYHKL